jgi:pilus assembly protein CpaF
VADGGTQKGEMTLRDLLKHSLRLRADRIILGDTCGGEVFELLQAMNTGHDGSMSTVHANNTPDALDRIELLLALSGAVLPLSAVRAYIASAVQILIHVSRLASGERKVMRISELCGSADGQYQIEDLFVYRMAGCDESGHGLGTFYATGTEPASLMRLAAFGIEVPGELFVPRELNAGIQFAEKGNRS